MGLHIKHDRAEHTHDNEPFRKIAKSLKLLFEEQKWEGLLIGTLNSKTAYFNNRIKKNQKVVFFDQKNLTKSK